MLIYSGNTPIMLPINPSPNNGKMTLIQFIVCIMILGFIGFLIYKLI
jgi:hypothetical protein